MIDMIKAMAVGVIRKGRIPNISFVESIELVTGWQRGMAGIPPRFLA